MECTPFPPLTPAPGCLLSLKLWHWQGNAAPLRSIPLQGLQTEKYALCLPVDWDLTHTRLDGRGAVPGSARRAPETLSDISETEGAWEQRFRQLHCIIIQSLTIRSKEKHQWLRMTWKCLWQTPITPEDGSLMNKKYIYIYILVQLHHGVQTLIKSSEDYSSWLHNIIYLHTYTVMAKNIGTLGKYDQRRLRKWICIVNPFELL